ncbi:MAG: hypothetical protein LBU85_08880 [Treponema sp.]|jgi:pyruvate formate-lyase activating enzyme-like uncharacterized protein|nr:hypothetical protein [Treponema sp.]
MKIKVIKGTVTQEGNEYGAGKELEIDDKNAERLIKLGYAEKAGGETVKETAEQKAARIRAVLEAKALELNIGPPEAVKAMSDKELKDGIVKAGGETVKGFFAELFGGNKN